MSKLKNKIKGLERDIKFLQYVNDTNYSIIKHICNKLNIQLEVDLEGTYLDGENISKSK